MLYRQEFRELTTLALPLVLAQLAQNTVSFVDTLMVGRLGNDALAGIAIGSTFFYFVLIVLAGVIFAIGPIVSQATGANDPETAARATRQGLWMSALLSLPAFALYWNAYPILLLLGQPEETAHDSSAYLRAISWGMLPALGTFSLRGLLEGKSDTRPIMFISFTGVILNIFFNDVLMFGRYGFPALGLVGTGYASSLVFVCMFLMSAIYIHFRYQDLHIFRGIRSPDPQMMKELVRVGGPIGLTLGFEMSMFSAAALAMGTLGKEQLAAHQIALQTASISFMVPLGFAIATSVRVGQAVGRKSVDRAEIAGHVGMLTCMGVMCVSALRFLAAAENYHWLLYQCCRCQQRERCSICNRISGDRRFISNRGRPAGQRIGSFARIERHNRGNGAYANFLLGSWSHQWLDLLFRIGLVGERFVAGNDAGTGNRRHTSVDSLSTSGASICGRINRSDALKPANFSTRIPTHVRCDNRH